jgi:hypothetical protein
VTGTAGTNISAFGAGDLDGDKKEDVLVLISTSETETLIAKRGHNGEHLWEESVTGMDLSALPASDLNGDEIADVLLGSYDQVYALGYREE